MSIRVDRGDLWSVNDVFVIIHPRCWPFRALAWIVNLFAPDLARRIRNRCYQGIVTAVRGDCLEVTWGGEETNR